MVAMFSTIDGSRRRRREWSPGTIFGSVLAHALVFGGVALAAASAPEPAPEPDPPLVEFSIDPAPPPLPPEPVEPAEPAPAPREPAPAAPSPTTSPGVVVPSPTTVPTQIPIVDPTLRPIDLSTLPVVGPPGPSSGTSGPSGPGEVRPGIPGGVVDEGSLSNEQRPSLRNGREMERVLRREYPSLLRDAGIAGRTVLRFVIGTDGRVEAGSIQVVETTRPEFAEASRRAVERMRFTPARVNGEPVRVLTMLPIEWMMPS